MLFDIRGTVFRVIEWGLDRVFSSLDSSQQNLAIESMVRAFYLACITPECFDEDIDDG